MLVSGMFGLRAVAALYFFPPRAAIQPRPSMSSSDPLTPYRSTASPPRVMPTQAIGSKNGTNRFGCVHVSNCESSVSASTKGALTTSRRSRGGGSDRRRSVWLVAGENDDEDKEGCPAFPLAEAATNVEAGVLEAARTTLDGAEELLGDLDAVISGCDKTIGDIALAVSQYSDGSFSGSSIAAIHRRQCLPQSKCIQSQRCHAQM